MTREDGKWMTEMALVAVHRETAYYRVFGTYRENWVEEDGSTFGPMSEGFEFADGPRQDGPPQIEVTPSLARIEVSGLASGRAQP